MLRQTDPHARKTMNRSDSGSLFGCASGVRSGRRAPFLQWLLVVLTLTLLPILASAQQSATPFVQGLGVVDSGEVVSVRIEGAKAISEEELQSVLTTRVSSWIEQIGYFVSLGSIGTNTQYTDQSSRDRDTNALMSYYRDRGYLSAHATWEVRADSASILELQKLDRVNRTLSKTKRKELPHIRDTVIFHITEGTPSKISGTAYQGLDKLPDELHNDLEAHSIVHVGVRYLRATVDSEIYRVEGILQKNGYPFFKYDSVIVESTQDQSVHVLFYFETNHRYRVGHASFAYDTGSGEKGKVSESLLRTELDFDSGSWYDGSKLQSTNQNLYKLGNFETVKMSLDTAKIQDVPEAEREGRALDVIIVLRMLTSQEIAPNLFIGEGLLGLSFGAGLDYSNRNTFGGAQFLNIGGSYQFLPSSQTRYNANANLTFPFRTIPFFGYIFPNITNSPMTVGGGFSRAEQVDRSAERLVNGHAGLNITIGPAENRTNFIPDLTVELAYRQYFLDTLKLLYKGSETKQINTIFSMNGQWDRTNSFFNPTNGFFMGGTVEIGTPYLKFLLPADYGSASYVKGIVHLKDFMSLAEHDQLILGGRVRFGYDYLLHGGVPVPALTDLPLERRFFAGGGTSVRGWPTQALLVAPSGDSLRLTTEGGYRIFELNIELRWSPFYYPIEVTTKQKLLSPIQFAFFFDAGQAWDYGVAIQPKQVALAIGTGIRYLTLFGAFRIDLGVKLFDPNPQWGNTLLDANGNSIVLNGVTQVYQRPAYPDTPGQWLFGKKFAWRDLEIEFNIGQAF